MAFSQGYSGSPAAEINVTPLIDVLLVLLIIFMVISPLLPKGLDSRVPQGKASSAALAPVVIEVRSLEQEPMRPPGATVAPPVVYRVDGKVMEFAQLRPALQSLLSAHPERPLFVDAERRLSYQPVAAVVGEAKQAGAVAVILRGSGQ